VTSLSGYVPARAVARKASCREVLKKVMEKENITWRSFWNGGSTSGPISTKWDVHSWPTIYVLDHTGVVRYKNVRGERMDEAVDALLKELKESK